LPSSLVRVIRDRKPVEVEAKQLYRGCDTGSHLAADGRLIEEQNLQVRESALTGEAQAVEKQADIQLPEETSQGDRVNMVFQGTEVVQGRVKVW